MTVDIEAMIARGSDEELEHYGVKGMRWGIRRDAEGRASVVKGSQAEETFDDFFADNRYSTAAKNSVKRYAKKELKALNEEFDKAAASGKPMGMDEYNDRLAGGLQYAAVKGYRAASIKRGVGIAAGVTVAYNLLSLGVAMAAGVDALNAAGIHVQHGEDSGLKRGRDYIILEFSLKRDASGKVIDITPLESENQEGVVHTDIFNMTPEDALAHYGVKGMRWGVRKDASGKAGVVRTGSFSGDGGTSRLEGRQGQPFTNKARETAVRAELKLLNNRPAYKGKTIEPGSKLEADYNADLEVHVNRGLRNAAIAGGIGRAVLRTSVIMLTGQMLGTALLAADSAIAEADRDDIANSEDEPAWAKDLVLDWKDTQDRNRTAAAEHSALSHADPGVTRIYQRYALTRNSLNQVVDIKAYGDEVRHSHILDDALAHYGVKGMRWGVTRTKLQIAEAQGGGGGGAEEEEEEEEELTEEERKKLLDKANLTEDEAFDLPPSVIKDWIAKSAASAKAGKQLNFKEYIDAQEAKYGNLGDPKNAAKFRKANPQASGMRAVSVSRSRASLRNDPDAPKAVAAKGMPRVNSDKGRSVTDSLDFKAKKVIQRSKTGTTTRTFNQAGLENSRSHVSSIDKRIGNWIERKLYDLLPNKEPSASSKATRAALARSTGIPRAGQTAASKAAPQVRPKDSSVARKVITKNGATTRTFKYDRDGKIVSRGTSTDIASQAKDWLSKTLGIGEKKPSGMPRLTSTGGTKPRASSTQKTRISTRIENESRARDRSIRKASNSLNSAYMRERDAARQRERYRDYGTTATRKEGNTTVKRTTYKSAPNYSRTEYTQSTGPDVPDIVAEWLKKQFGHDALTDSDHLAHWGVKGMKWGVRRSEAELVKARSVADRLADARSQDKTAIVRTGKSYSTGEALAAAELKSIAKKYGTSALTNADLKQLNERLTLEKNYASLTPKQKTKLQKTLDGVNTAVKLNQKLGNPAGKAAKAIIDKQTAGSASKAAAAARMAASAAAGSSKKSKKSKKSSGDMPKAGDNLKVTLADLDAIAKISASSPSSSLSSRPSSTEVVTKK